MTEPITQTPTEEIAKQNTETRSQQRIQELSDKVELTAKERDEKDRLFKEESEKRTAAEKERDFYQGFSDVLATNPAAKDHKEDILAKVKSGYTVEDATFAVLGKAGKLGAPAKETVMPQVAGGSAATTPQSGQKEVKDMTLAEKRDQLSKDLIWS